MEGKNYNKVHQVTMHCTDKWNYEKGNSPVSWTVNKEGKRNGYEKTCTAENVRVGTGRNYGFEPGSVRFG